MSDFGKCLSVLTFKRYVKVRPTRFNK